MRTRRAAGCTSSTDTSTIDVSGAPDDGGEFAGDAGPRGPSAVHAVIQARGAVRSSSGLVAATTSSTKLGDTVRSHECAHLAAGLQALQHLVHAAARARAAEEAFDAQDVTRSAPLPRTTRRAASTRRRTPRGLGVSSSVYGRSDSPSNTKSVLKCTRTALISTAARASVRTRPRVGHERGRRVAFGAIDVRVGGAVDDHIGTDGGDRRQRVAESVTSRSGTRRGSTTSWRGASCAVMASPS